MQMFRTCIVESRVSEEEQSFDPADFTRQRTVDRIQEIRDHLKDELIPAAEKRADASFLLPFVQYLDAWASRLSDQVNEPLEFLALATRNLLEFSLLIPVVFDSADSRMKFLNEALRLDPGDLQERLSKVFSEIGAQLPVSSVENIDWLPESYVRLTAKRDTVDAWLHKLCSKLMHPTAIMIMAPQAIADEPKRITLCVAGLQYLGRCYNYLAEATFHSEQPNA